MELLRETLMRDVPGIETANQGRVVEAAYSPFNCRSACLQRLIWERCRCLDLGLQLPFFKPSLFCGAFGENITNAKMFFDAEKYKRGHCLEWDGTSLDSEECSFLHNIVERLENLSKGLLLCHTTRSMDGAPLIVLFVLNRFKNIIFEDNRDQF